MNTRTFFDRLCHSQIPCRVVVLLVVLVWNSLAFGIEIHDAAKKGNLEKVKTLIKDDPNLVFSKATCGQTPLHWAVIKCHKDVVELLLANKADVNTKDGGGWTPLHWAVIKCHKDMVELLLANKADVNANEDLGRTPLRLAVSSGCKDMVELLLANKAKLDIYAAIAIGDVAKVEQFINDKPDLVFSRDIDTTPLHYAARDGHKDMVKLLLANEADVNAKGNSGETPLHKATMNGHKDVVKLLLANEADVNAKDNSGETPLHKVAMNGHKEVAELLLANKADVNAKSNSGETPLHEAAMNGHKDLVKLLLANKADYSIHNAVAMGDLEKVKALLKDNPDLVFSKAAIGRTPLYWAAIRGNKDMVELLFANKAEVNVKDNGGETPLRVAENNGKRDIAEWLRQHGCHE